VQGAGERGDGRRDRAVHVGERACDDARREGRSVQFVIGVQDQADVEDARLALGRHLALEHVEKVGGDVEFGFRRDRVLAVAYAFDGGDEDGKLRRQAGRRAQRALARDVATLLVVEVERGDGGAQHVHRLGVAREGADEFDDLRRQLVVLADVAFERVEFRLSRQPTVPEQVDGLFKSRMRGQVVNVVALINEYALLAVHVAD
jgi:hypothetical protein